MQPTVIKSWDDQKNVGMEKVERVSWMFTNQQVKVKSGYDN